MNIKQVVVALAIGAAAMGAYAQSGEIVPAYGETVGGFPVWEERTVHELTNRARVAPATDLAGCTGCSAAELSGCYSAIAPLTYLSNLNKSARFESQWIEKNGWAGTHDTPCVLRTNIASLYPDSCDASYSCACTGSGTTAWTTRVSYFGATPSAENVAGGYVLPKDAFYTWLLESAPSATCAWSLPNGHRWNILKTPTAGLGVGYRAAGSYWTQDFGNGTAADTLKLVSGSHWASDGSRQGATVEFWANWYNSGGAPSQANVVIDGTARAMSLSRGTTSNGAWTVSRTDVATGCHRYYFSFKNSVGTEYTFPTSGSFGVGPAGSCSDWIATRTAAATTKGDLNSDGRSDLIWRNSVSGQNSFWFMDGTSVLGGGFISPVSDTAWKLAGVDDFNLDGQADLVWHNDTNGMNTVWYMNGVNYQSQAGLPSAGSTAWKIAGAGDFDGDGKADLIWRNTSTGENTIWFMNNTALLGAAAITPVSDLNWKIVGAGDFDNNGKDDLAWWNSADGSFVVWFMNGTVSQSWFIGRVADTSWRVAAVGDFDGNGKTDVMWKRTDGSIALWTMDGPNVTGGGFAGQVADLTWDLAGVR